MKRTLLLTGATGFLGSHLLRHFVGQYRLVILKRKTSSLKKIKDLLPYVKFYNSDEHDLEIVFKREKIHAIIHAATDYGRDHVVDRVVETNVVFPLRLVRLSLAYGVSFFINIDTFFNVAGQRYSHLPVYSLSKRQLWEWLTLLRNSKLTMINMKLAHVYGPDDQPEKFVPQMFHRMKSNEPLIKLTNGKQKRDFVYIDDVVKACDLVLKKAVRINEDLLELEVGTGVSVSIRHFLQAMKQITSSSSHLKFGAVPARRNEFRDHRSNVRRLKKITNWKPQIDYKQGLLRMNAQLGTPS